AEPDSVEFVLERESAGATFEEAAATAAGLGPALRAELEALGATADVSVRGPAIRDLSLVSARAAATVRFSTDGLADPETGPAAYGALCDTMRGLATKLGCTAQGPRMVAANARSVEQAAVAKAVENAYPHAEGAAQVMQVAIVAVQRVRVDAVKWDDAAEAAAAEAAAPQADPARTVCTARVTVIYEYAAGAP
ncbi:MAG: hypothetical protein JXR94_08485, partial [Candidatus Hydrogenedentes bacterium]|nr:hypothetical protein [Candidatus Hydrogenedentota bacterium]